MTKEQAKKLLPAITHFAKGGNLWGYNSNEWYKQSKLWLDDDGIQNIIEDKHFEARKADALGEEIEVSLTLHGITPWQICNHPTWSGMHHYRAKKRKWDEDIPEDGILCWVWTTDEDEGSIIAIINKKHDPSHRNWAYQATNFDAWKYAKPIKPEDLWQGES